RPLRSRKHEGRDGARGPGPAGRAWKRDAALLRGTPEADGAPMKPVARDPGGRVHLTVHRDPASGEETAALSAPLFGEAWQNDVAAAGAGTAPGGLAGPPPREGAGG